MNAPIDMSNFIAPKSDQLNADDLIGKTKTITVSRVSANPDSLEQPVSIFFEDDDGKPFKPCKSMRRVMVAVWGADATEYVGRSMTLYRDPKVQFGGMAVGGIRISHMSHIDKDVTMALTATRAKRAPYTVRPLPQDQEAAAPEKPKYDLPKIEAGVMKSLENASGPDSLSAAWAAEKTAINILKKEAPDAFRRVVARKDELKAEFEKAADEAEDNEDQAGLNY